MTSEQHCGQRCETCENISCTYHKLKKEIGRTRHWQTGKNHTCIRVEFTPASFTAEMGCASHSSQPVPDDSEQFIITGFQLKQLQDHADLDFVCQAIRHHPILEDWTRVLNDAWMQERDERIKAEAAKAERERVLDEAIDRMDGIEYAKDPCVGAVVPFAVVVGVLESLRGGDAP